MQKRVRTVEILSVEQIPFEQVENSLGVPREVFLRHPRYEDIVISLTTLVCGRSQMTPIIESGEYTSERFKFSAARYSLMKTDNQRIVMRVHPIGDQITRFENEFGLNNQEIDQLYQGKLISKEIDLYHDGELIDCLIQLQPNTNLIAAVPKFSIDIPSVLGQVEQSPENKQKLKNCEEITVVQKEGQVYNVRLCLYSYNMISVSENFDRLMQHANQSASTLDHKKQIPSVFSGNGPENEMEKDVTYENEQTHTGVKR